MDFDDNTLFCVSVCVEKRKIQVKSVETRITFFSKKIKRKKRKKGKKKKKKRCFGLWDGTSVLVFKRRDQPSLSYALLILLY